MRTACSWPDAGWVRTIPKPDTSRVAAGAVAEAMGTFMLVLTIVSIVIAAAVAQPIAGGLYGSLAVPLAGGFALAGWVAGLGRISRAHLNPAVTVGLAVNRRFPWKHVPAYFAAQLGGAAGATLIAWGMFGDRARTVAKLGATYLAPGVDVWQAILMDTAVTCVLVLLIVSVGLGGVLAATRYRQFLRRENAPS